MTTKLIYDDCNGDPTCVIATGLLSTYANLEMSILNILKGRVN